MIVLSDLLRPRRAFFRPSRWRELLQSFVPNNISFPLQNIEKSEDSMQTSINHQCLPLVKTVLSFVDGSFFARVDLS